MKLKTRLISAVITLGLVNAVFINRHNVQYAVYRAQRAEVFTERTVHEYRKNDYERQHTELQNGEVTCL